MKKLFLLLLLLFCMGNVFAQNFPITGINISMLTNADANTANWGQGASPFSISARTALDSNRRVSGVVMESKILVTIKSGGNKICGAYTSANAPQSNFSSAVKVWNGKNGASLLGQDCTLKPGEYELCVQFFGYQNGKETALSEEKCKTFTVSGGTATSDITYQPPQAISPANGTVISEADLKKPINFRWTPIVPKPKEAVTYRLKVWQLMQGQNGSQAMKANQPIITKEVDNINQSMVTNLVTGPCKPPYLCDFVWQVQAVNREGKPVGGNGGVSEAWSFSVSGTYSITIQNLKVECSKNNSYSFTVNVSNPNNSIAIFDKLEVVVVNGVTIAPINITPTIPPIGSTIPNYGNINVSGSFTYGTPITTVCLKGYIKEQLNPTLNQASTFTCDTLKCACDYCTKNIEFDNDAPTVTHSGNTLNIVHPIWNMSAATIVGVKAEIIEFDRYVGDECMTCNKDASIWGNFISGTYGVPGAFAVATGGGVTGNTHHTIYFSGPGLGIPFNLNISTPPLSNLSCCCDKITVTIRYTFIFKDGNECRYCSQIQKYNYQKGTCPAIPNDGTGSINNTKNN